MKNSYGQYSDESVFNDYEESIMFDEDDPDFKSSNDLEFTVHSSHTCNKNGKLAGK